MIYLLGFVVLVLATARATRVVVIDEIAEPLRTKVMTRWPPPSKPSKLVRCYWCSGFWMSGLICATTLAVACKAGWLPWLSLALLPVLTFAVAYASSWVLDKEGIADGA